MCSSVFTIADLLLLRNNWNNFQTSVYHKVNDKLELGYKIEYSTDRTDTKFSMAAKYSVDKDLVLRVGTGPRVIWSFNYTYRYIC